MRILVVGAGIAGLALVRALTKHGIDAVAFDKRPGTTTEGLGINLPGNAIRALDEVGVGVPLRQLGPPVDRREYRTPRGRLLFTVDEREFWGEPLVPRCVLRPDLAAALADGLPVDSIRWNASVSAVRATHAGAEVELADGTIERGDLVVGADGVRSTVRESVFPGAARTVSPVSATSLRFVGRDPGGIDAWTLWSDAKGAMLLIPMSGGRLYGYASATQGDTIGTDRTWIEATFAKYPEPVRTVVATLGDVYHSPVEEVRIPRWHAGRAVLIGDAAHAIAPFWAQGGALAVEDALVLADVLAGGLDASKAGAAFEERRRARVEHVRAATDRLARTAAMPTWLRDLALPFAGPKAYREAYGPLRGSVLA
ncbi:putative salicylate hydroxylase [Virgisporangium aliadipatigenens]|uniref:Putative salicylate hydroxylase n=1 Tax=Virgisporangium aliadipatigenens TaxID=741659 RepID=A0A8J4DSJ9_9ACTN|nr:FAD-dependent monooxygenase [Virgisporangium aliadipatigenens]GIJ49315.1 putative salicylate hydroxylase [Virgisporangium aliadipatigenens]